MRPKHLSGGTNEAKENAGCVTALGQEQKTALRAIHDNTITFIHGPAGSGKTWLAVAYGVRELLKDKYERLVLTRPCVEAMGEKLGFLPGDSDDKIAPYMIPVFDILSRRLSMKEINKLQNEGRITTLPLAFHRGVTFTNAYVVGDEFQNTLVQQMRMFLTRIGSGSKMVITGDVTQSDVNHGKIDGLSDAIKRFKDVEDIGVVGLTSASIVRHKIIKVIEEKYSQ